MLGNLRKTYKQNGNDQYTINRFIQKEGISTLRPDQKFICSNKTLMKVEKGIYLNNSSIYKNISQKLQYEFSYEPILNQSLEIFTTHLINAFYGDKPSFYFMEDALDTLSKSSVLIYKEMYFLLKACYQFLFLSRDLNPSRFKQLETYFDLLPLPLQFVFSYTFALYFYHYHHQLTHIEKTIQLFETTTHHKIQKIINDLSFYYELKTHHITRLNYSFSFLIPCYFSYRFSNLQPFHFNDWLDASIYSDLGFFSVLKYDYTSANHYFQKAMKLHPCILAKYLPAYLETLYQTEGSMSRATFYLKQLQRFPHFKDWVTYFYTFPYLPVRKKDLDFLLKGEYTAYNDYLLRFLLRYNKKS